MQVQEQQVIGAALPDEEQALLDALRALAPWIGSPARQIDADRTPLYPGPLYKAGFLLMGHAAHAVRSCAEAVRLLYEAAGPAAVYEREPLERCFRDLHTATQHQYLFSGELPRQVTSLASGNRPII